MPGPETTTRIRTRSTTPLFAPGLPSVSGSLGETPLAETVQFIASLRKTGALALEDPSGTSGSIGFDAGRLVHAFCPPQVGRAAFFRLMAWRAGRYLFIPGPPPSETTLDASTDALLLEAMRRLDELTRLRPQLPSESTVLHRHRHQALQTVPLTPLHLAVLLRIDGRTTVGGLLASDPDPTLVEILIELLAWGVVRAQADQAWMEDLLLAPTPAGELAADPASADLAARLLVACRERTSLRELAHALDCGDEPAIAAARYLLALGLVEALAGDPVLLAY